MNTGSAAFPRRAMTAAFAVATALTTAMSAFAASALVPISIDSYTNTSSQHATQVEPDSFAHGNTVVTAVQTGRFTDGGASNICWATSSDSGATWTSGCLPGITKLENASNPYDRVSDPAVAYDPKHDVWMISSLALTVSGGAVNGKAVLTSRSTDGGLTWGNPIVVTSQGNVDKNWIVCDTHAASPYYGNCYTEWDDNGAGNALYMSTSTDGGLTWGARLRPANNATGLGGQPVVQPDGTVIVPSANAYETAIIAFRSTNGGASWSSSVTVTTVADHVVAGNLRTGPLPSAEIDAAGKVYVVWQDCRFRRGCKSNDIVMSTSTDGVTWSPVVRIPIDKTTSSVDHFIPGLAVDPTTSGDSAKLALAYYYYPSASCSASKCRLYVGYISSSDGGTTWAASQQLAGPMNLGWLPSTTQGRMVGDYISTSFVNGSPIPFVSVAAANTGTVFNQRLNAVSGLTAVSGSFVATASGEHAIPNAASDHAAANAPIVTH